MYNKYTLHKRLFTANRSASPRVWCRIHRLLYRVCVGAPTAETSSEGTSSYAHIHLLARTQLYSHSRLSQICHCKGASAIRRRVVPYVVVHRYYIGAVYRLRVGAPTTETSSEGTSSYAHIHLLARAQLYSHSRLSQICHCKGAIRTDRTNAAQTPKH